jgi:hypothetical protein
MNSLESLNSQNVTVAQPNSRVSLLIHIFTERFNGLFDLIVKCEDTDPNSKYTYKNDGDDEMIIDEEVEVLDNLFKTMTKDEKNEDVEQLKDHIIKLCSANDKKYEEAKKYPAFVQDWFDWL